jgi:hypothetical protein
VAEGLYEHLWRELNLTSELQRALLFSSLSQGYWEITYDPFAGKPQRHILDPHTGAPIDGPLAELVLEEVTAAAKKAGIPEELAMAHVVKTTYEGEISVKALPGENVLIDPAAESFDSAKYAIITHNLTPDEIKARWGKDTAPDAIALASQPALMYQKMTDKRPKTVRRVFCGYFRPAARAAERSLRDLDRGSRRDHLRGRLAVPVQRAAAREVPRPRVDGGSAGSAADDRGALTAAGAEPHDLADRRAQGPDAQAADARAGRPLRQRITAEPGRINEYVPIAGSSRSGSRVPNLPSYVFEHLNADHDGHRRDLQHAADAAGQAPARIDSGEGIDLIQETASDDMLPPIRRLEESLVRAGYLIAMLAQKFYSEPAPDEHQGSQRLHGHAQVHGR